MSDLKNPDHHISPETELFIYFVGALIGGAILVGSFVYLAFWYFH